MKREKHSPPRWADRFLEWYCSPKFIEETQGDLHEAFHRRCKESGVQWAGVLFVLDVMGSLSFRTLDYSLLPQRNFSTMFGSYLTLTFRTLSRTTVFSFVNIMGLAIGMSAFFLIMQYVSFERSFDQFHANSDRTYRVCMEVTTPTVQAVNATNSPATGPALMADYPEVEDYARMVPHSIVKGELVALSYTNEKNETKVFYEDKIYIVDPSFLTVLTFPLQYGDPASALTDPSSIVITESIAEKYFGDENPIGKTLVVNGGQPYAVTAVTKNIPGNSHVAFDILMSDWMTENLKDRYDQQFMWRWPEFYTYVRLAPNTDLKEFGSKIKGFYHQHNGEDLKKRNVKLRPVLQPLTDIHLRSSEIGREREPRGSEKTIYFLLIIAGLIVVIAWINYINLSTSKSAERAREIGVRKVVGAAKRQLITQFLFESAIINFLALMLAFVLTALVYPYFVELTGKDMGTNVLEAPLGGEPQFWLVVGSIFFSGSFLAGFYPAFMLSSFKIVNTLRGKFLGSVSGIALRKVLVTAQFVISVALIAGTIMVYRQIQFMRTHELGFAKEQLMVVKPPHIGDSTIIERQKSFITELKSNSRIKNVTGTSEIPGRLITNRNFIGRFGETADTRIPASHYYIDDAFMPTYGVKVLAGRNFKDTEKLVSPEAKANPIIINRKTAEDLGFTSPEEAVDQLVTFAYMEDDQWTGEIIGVVENFSQVSLKTDYERIIFFPVEKMAYFTVNMDMENPQETISFMREKYEISFPGNPFDYFFIDQYFDSQYRDDQKFSNVLGLFTGLALFVAGLGLYGLTIFMVTQRTKELALRRIFGASSANLVSLFSREFVRLVILSNVIALPAAYFIADQWLSNFSFRADVGWIIFIAPFLVLIAISLSTVGFQTIRAGFTNPIKFLRSE